MSKNITKTVLLRSTILVGAAAFALPAFAQVAVPAESVPANGTTANGAPASGTAVASAPEAEQTIVVTGSLIKNPNLVRSTPVTVTTADEISLKQSNVAEEVLREIPGVVASLGSAVNNGATGSSYVDLRGIGLNRNIVLLDGRRIVPAGLQGAVDLNNIPLALIDRVDALTGAAVTTYGADAVSGVVNFVTKQNFTGIDFSGSEQITGRGDGNTYRTDLTIGGNFADDKGNAVLSIGYQHADPVYQGDRGFSVNNVNSQDGSIGGSGTTVPARFSGTRGIDPATGQPSILPAASGFGADGQPIAVPGGQNNGGTRQLNVDTGQAVGTYHLFNFNPYNIFQTPFQRYNIFAQAKYDVSDSIEFYTRGLFSKNTVETIIAPSGVFTTGIVLPLSNPYLPAAARNQLCAFNVAAATPSPVLDAKGNPVASAVINYQPRFTPAQCAAAATATPTIADPVTGLQVTNPAYKTVAVNVARRFVEAGPRISNFVTQVFDYELGARGKFNSHLDWDINGSYGQSENRQTETGYILTSRAKNAALATNTTTCLSDPGGLGCVPVNLFGPAGSITPQQIAYLSAASTSAITTSLAQVRGTVSGDVGYSVPFATDPVSFALGAEYRKYTAGQTSDILAQTAGELGGGAAAVVPFNGGYQVKEVYGELVAPLVQDKPFFESLTFEAGIRYSSYNVDAPSRPSYNTLTYKGGGSWAPGFGVKFRGNYSRAVRAPNISELFAPSVTGLTSIAVDPCAGNAPLSNATLRAVCLAQGAPANTIGSIINPSAAQANEHSGGNLALKPEKADTYTVGVVFQPPMIRGLSLTVDYYNIAVNGAVSTPTSNDALNACFGAGNLSVTNPACLSTQRNPLTGGLDGNSADTPGVALPLSNLGRILTDGIDATVNYSRDLNIFKLGLSFNGNYTFRSKFQATPDGLNRECVGFYSVNCAADGGNNPGSIQPKWQISQRTTFSFNAFDISVLYRHIDKMRQEPDDITNPNGNGPAFGNFGRIPAADYVDLTGRVTVNEHLTLTLTVQNLLDKQPPIVGSTIGTAAFNSGNTYPSTYDALGRRFAFTARVRY